MQIKGLRDYCGQEGTDVDKNVFAGSEHLVTRDRAAQLLAVGLVDVIGDKPHPDDLKVDADVEGGEKKIEPIANKRAPAPRNKAAPKAAAKAKGSQPA